MKIAEIDWQAFWNALSHQDCAGRDRWVGRWAFADDGARLSMAPALSQSGCYSIVGDGEVPDHDVFVVRTLRTATQASQKACSRLESDKARQAPIYIRLAAAPSRIDMSGWNSVKSMNWQRCLRSEKALSRSF